MMIDNYKIMREIKLIRQSLLNLEKYNAAIGDWLPNKTVKRFLDYGNTQMRELELANEIAISKIGRRKFYSLKSIIKLLDNNKVILKNKENTNSSNPKIK